MGNCRWKNAEKEREKRGRERGIEKMSGRRGDSIELESDYKKT